MRAVRLGWQALRREWRAGELGILALALVVAVGAVTSVGFFVDRVNAAMNRQAATLMAADRVVTSPQPIPAAWREEAARRQLRSSVTMSFRSVVMGPARPQLAEVKAVDGAYPLRGELRAADADAPAGTVTGPPARGTVWSDARLLALLDVAPGDPVTVGDLDLTLDRLLAYEPDRATAFFGIAPRLLMRVEDVPATGLIQPGSQVRYRLLLAGEAATLAGFRAWISPQLKAGARFEDVREARPQIGTALDRAGRFLGLAALVSVLLCGVAVATCARRHAERQADTAAVLRCLGAAQRTVLVIYLTKLTLLGLAASLLGTLLGYLGQAGIAALVGDLLGGDLPAATARPAGFGIAIGLLTLTAFGLPPLVRLRRVPPLRVLRRDLGAPPLGVWGLYGIGAVALGAMMAWISGDPHLTGWLLAGTVGALLVLGGAAWLLVRALSPLRSRVGVALRFGMASIARHPGDSALQVLAFGLGFMALLLLAVVRDDLLDAWQARVPAEAPNHFLINIQPDQRDAVAAWFNARGIDNVTLHPMSRARLTAINGNDTAGGGGVSGHARHWVDHGFNLSAAAVPQVDNRIVAGRWWTTAQLDAPLVSVEAGMAANLGVGIGDRLRFRIADREIEVTVANIRRVEWDNFRVNFFLVTTPGALAGVPAQYVTSVYLPPAQRTLTGDLVRAFPSITVFDVETILSQVRGVIDQVVRAVEFVFLFTLAAGVMVLYAALHANLEARQQEGAVLRALGARRSQLRLGLLGEYLTLGVLAGLLGAAAAGVVGLVLADQVLNLAYRPQPWLLLAGALLGGAVVGIAGMLGSQPVVRLPPLAVLRRGG